ncbi:SgcJ/EcaC family oxidoreductase [Sphingomonas koreensis]|nr:SgcJ/EcaC family oxidoreductase [Sphingomonas koreensis]
MRHIGFAVALAACAAPTLAATPVDQAKVQVLAAMAASAAGWNAGDLDRFMAVYADAPSTTFVTGTGVAHGKAEIATHYQAYFTGDRVAERGTLSFEPLDFRLIDSTHALLIARYHVAPAGKRTKEWTGPTSLLLVKQPDGWRIAADHSS